MRKQEAGSNTLRHKACACTTLWIKVKKAQKNILKVRWTDELESKVLKGNSHANENG